MAQRYFQVSFESKKTKHPQGSIKEFIFSEGRHKKEAFELAKELLDEKFPEYTEFFKLPDVEVEYTNVDEYLAAQPKVEPVTTPVADQAAFNTDDEKGMTDDDLRAYVALITLFGLADEYTTEMLNDAEGFAQAPFNGTPEEQTAFGALYEAMLVFMPAIYERIKEDQLLRLINHVDSKIGALTPYQVTEFGIAFINHSLKMEYQQEIDLPQSEKQQTEETEHKKINGLQPSQPVKNEESAQDATPQKIEPLEFAPVIMPDTFKEDLADLNSRIAALAVGESFYIDGLSNRLYHACNAYSKSSLDIINRDPALIEWSKNAPKTDNEDTLVFGTAFHTMVLEPDLFDEQFLIMPELNLRTNAGKDEKIEIEAEAKRHGKDILSSDQHKQLVLMHGSVFAHPTAKKLFADGTAERSIFFRWSENLVVRIRPDWITEIHGKTFIVDLKSCADASKFEKSIDDFRYHIQDAFYSYVFERATGVTPIFAFCATGKAVEMGRYPTRLVLLDEHDKEVGYNAFQSNIDTIEGCLSSGIWGGFETVQRPQWARRNDNFF